MKTGDEFRKDVVAVAEQYAKEIIELMADNRELTYTFNAENVFGWRKVLDYIILHLIGYGCSIDHNFHYDMEDPEPNTHQLHIVKIKESYVI